MNYQILQGRIGKIELRTLDGGNTVVNFSLATNESYKNKQGEKVEETTWHDCNAWGKTAEIINTYFSKGDVITIHGSKKVRKWEDKEGNTRYQHFTKVDRFEFPLTVRPKDHTNEIRETPLPSPPQDATDDNIPF